MGFHRPAFDVYLIGPGDRIAVAPAQLDTASDYTLFASAVASFDLKLSLPFPRQIGISGAGGTYTATVSFPPDGLVSLFVTDYREFCFLSSPLIGFHAPAPSATNQRSVLGLSGFLQYFRLVLEPSPPLIELHPIAGVAGALPKDRGLHEFLASLRAP
jgi:hypothetical protein